MTTPAQTSQLSKNAKSIYALYEDCLAAVKPTSSIQSLGTYQAVESLAIGCVDTLDADTDTHLTSRYMSKVEGRRSGTVP